MTKTIFRTAILACLCVLGSLGRATTVWAQDGYVPEVGVSSPTPGAGWGEVPQLNDLDARIDLSTQYTVFTAEDMRLTYGGLPVIVLGLSAQATSVMRTYVAVGYGRRTGDPYQQQSGFDSPGAVSVRTVPVQFGLKFDMASSQKLRLNGGFGLEIAWMEETTPGLDEFGRPGDQTSSGINGGYHFTFGPELRLGQGNSVIGLEFGWGGAKGNVYKGDHRHGLDLTGYQLRFHAALEL